MPQAMINSIAILVFGTALTVVTTWFWKSRDAAVRKAERIAEEHAKTVVRITELEQKLALVNQAVIPISTAFQAILIKELTHYHTPEMDALLVKVGPPITLTPEEEARLAVLLEERTRDMGPQISESERDAATILPAVMKRAREESESLEHDEAFKLKELLKRAEELKLNLVSMVAVRGLPVSENTDTDSSESAQSLKKIEEHTAATAESLAALNKRAVGKLADTTVKKAKDAEQN